jgi:acetyl esterase/lipase
VTVRVEITDGLVLGTTGDRDLRGDLFRPPSPDGSRLPGVIFVHGGGWRTGDRQQLRGYGVLVGRQGYVGLCIEYRLIPEGTYPDNLHDVKAAIRWMRANADELNVDPNRIAIEGNSAGAHLALLAAGTGDVPELEGNGGHPEVSSSVQCVAAIYAPTVFSAGDSTPGSVPLLALIDGGGTAELARQASPLAHVTASFPPTMLIHGTHDELVPPKASLLMYEALIEAGVPAELHMVAEQPHAFDAAGPFGRQAADNMVHFFNRYL